VFPTGPEEARTRCLIRQQAAAPSRTLTGHERPGASGWLATKRTLRPHDGQDHRPRPTLVQRTTTGPAPAWAISRLNQTGIELGGEASGDAIEICYEQDLYARKQDPAGSPTHPGRRCDPAQIHVFEPGTPNKVLPYTGAPMEGLDVEPSTTTFL
jgi:hypothetical protein